MYKVRKFTDEELKFSQDIREAFESACFTLKNGWNISLVSSILTGSADSSLQ